MSGAVEEKEQDITSAQATAAFEAGFNDEEGAATVTPPAPSATPEPTPAPTPAPEYVQVTREDWDRVNSKAAKVDEIEVNFGKMRDTAFGKIGGLERALAGIQQATPQGAAVEVSATDFAELQEHYPELAEQTVKGLNKVLGKLKGTGGAPVDPKVFDEKVSEISRSVTSHVIDATLDAIVDGDWQQEVKSDKFKDWIKAQPADVKTLGESDKLRDASRLMRLYRKHLDTPAPTPAPSQAPAAPAQPSMRQRQMAAAVATKGEASAPAPKGKTPFEQGFEEDD
jgi:hypothetical protein